MPVQGIGATSEAGAQDGAPVLRLFLLGGFRATRDAGPAPERWTRGTARDLVKLLALAPGHQLHREQAAELLWPAAEQESALRSLRVALHAARRTLEPELAPRATSSYLITDKALIRLESAVIRVDVDEVEQATVSALADGGPAMLAEALGLFTGELLPEDRFAAWAGPRREQLRQLHDRLRLAHARAQVTSGDADEGIQAARAYVEEHPVDELGHRVLIEAYLRLGLRREAVRQYHRCREVLDGELGVRPGPETERLHVRALADDDQPEQGAGVVPVPAPVLAAGARRLLGRDEVVARLVRPARVVRLVSGDAGLGKTAVVVEAAHCAHESGTAVLWGAGRAVEGPTPYAAFADAIDAWLASSTPAQRARVGADYPELAPLLPSLGLADPTRTRSPEEERNRIFSATTALLAEIASHAPLLVVLDDLHETDLGSFQLLAHVARRLGGTSSRVSFLATYRPDAVPPTDARRDVLAALERAGLAEQVDLPPLKREECEELVREVAGDAARSEAVRQQIWELALGNPLFALELARGAGAQRLPGEDPPRGVRQLVRARLGRLDPVARRVVEVVAVGGPDASLAEVVEVAATGTHPSLSPAQAATGAEQAVEAAVLSESVVVVDGQHHAGLTFQHPLIRLTCYEELSAARRQLLHGAYAEAVLRRRPDAVDALATHLSRADDPRAVDYLRRAARRAASMYANDAADRYFVQLTDRLDTLTTEAAWARIDRSAVLERMARYDDAIAVLRDAVVQLDRARDDDGVVMATGRLAIVLARAGSAQEALDLLAEHPVGAGTAPEPATVHHLGRARALLVLGSYPDAVEASADALSCAEGAGAPVRRGLLARSLAARASALALAGRFDAAGDAADAALPHAEVFGDPQVLGTVLSVQREQARRSGRLREAVDTGERALDNAERSGDPAGAAFEQANLAELYLLLGDDRTAGGLAQAAVASSHDHPDWSTPYALVALARWQIHVEHEKADSTIRAAEGVAADLGDHQARQEAAAARSEWVESRRGPASG